MSIFEFEKKGKIAVFTLNRPDKYNAYNPAMLYDMEKAMFEFMEDKSLFVGIVTGAGPKAFCSGADVVEMFPFVKETADCPWKFPKIPMKGLYVTKPLIAAVNGIAYGGGGELALSCDIRIASENAAFKWPEPSLGLIPRFGGTQRLPRLIGQAKAMEILLTSQKVDAKTAQELGLVSRVVPQDQLMDTAMEIAEKICLSAPLAVQYIKQCITKGSSMELEDGLELENRLGLALYQTQDYEEGRTAFREKRKPEFKGC